MAAFFNGAAAFAICSSVGVSVGAQVEHLARRVVLPIRVEGGDERTGDTRQRHAAGRVGDELLVIGTALLVDTGQAAGERRQVVVLHASGRDVVEQDLERHAGVLLQRLGVGERLLRHAHAVHDEEVGLGLGVWGDGPEFIRA